MKSRAEEGSRLLAQYREQTGLRAEDRARVLRRLQHRLAQGERPSPQLDAAPPELPRSSGRLTRASVGVVAGVLVLGGGYASLRVAEPESPRPAAAAAMRSASSRAPGVHVVERVAGAAAPALSPQSAATPAIGLAGARSPSVTAHAPEVARPRRVEPGRRDSTPPNPLAEAQTEPETPAPARPAPGSPTPARSAAIPPSPVPDRSPPQPSADSLAQEMQLMEAAHAALRGGDARRALGLLAEHTWRYPAGHLAEARDVARILALCQVGRDAQARAQTRKFLAARPGSPFAARLSVGCDVAPSAAGSHVP